MTVSEVRLLLELDVVRPMNSTMKVLFRPTGSGAYDCLLCASDRYTVGYTRKIRLQDHFDRHPPGIHINILTLI